MQGQFKAELEVTLQEQGWSEEELQQLVHLQLAIVIHFLLG